MEEKFRKAMVTNASMDNEKSALTYQVELLKDQLEECEEQSALVTKELREKSRDYELLKRSHQETQRAVQLLQVFNVLFFIAFCSFFPYSLIVFSAAGLIPFICQCSSQFFRSPAGFCQIRT